MDLQDKYPKCQAYPPVPNWYTSNIAAIIEPHFFVYATRNIIVILGLKDFRYFNSITAAKEKINAINAHDVFCYVGGADKTVRVWNIVANSLTTSHAVHKAEITALKVIRKGTVIISGDKAGRVVVAEAFRKDQTISAKVNSEVTCISTVHRDHTDYAAIGYGNGIVLVEEITENLELKTVYQFSSENDPIMAIDWQKKFSDGQWPWLAYSTKRLKRIVIYDIPSQTEVAPIHLPKPPAKATGQQVSSAWIEVSWSPCVENRLYVTSYVGTILVFDIAPRAAKIRNQERMENHSRNVFSINWYNGGTNCITTSLDSQVIKWNVNNQKCLQVMKTQAAFPYALDISPTAPYRLSIAMGDNAIKLWDFQKNESVMGSKGENHNYYTSSIVWKGLQGKTLRILCHPSKEGLVAYVNEYGRLGLYDTLNQRYTYFKQLYKSMECPMIAWGFDLSTCLYDMDMTDTLIACSSNDVNIYVYNINQPNQPVIALNDILEQRNPLWYDTLKSKDGVHRTCMAIDKKCIAFGHVDGVVEVYCRSTLQLVYVSNFHRQKITAMDWKDDYLATASEQGIVAIHDLTSQMTESTDTVLPTSEIYKSMQCNQKTITVLKWTREPNKYVLAAGLQDGHVVVWEMDKIIAVFDQHRASILSICWNHCDQHVLFSSSEDRFIYQWSYMDYKVSAPIKFGSSLYDREMTRINQHGSKNNKRKKDGQMDSRLCDLKKQKVIEVNKDMMVSTLQSEKSASRLNKERKCMYLANVMFDGRIEAVMKELLAELNEQERSDPLVNQYAGIFTANDSHEPDIYEFLFGDKEDAFQLARIEEKSIQTKASTQSINDMSIGFDKQLAMNLMLSQADTLFDETKSSILDWIVLAMSPQAGKDVWIDLMKKQAKKMERENQYHLAASCYIACSHIYDAIEIYQRYGLYREAITLAKLRLPKDEQLLSELYLKLASQFQTGEEDQLAAIW
ncbi:unnamed protein product [Rhizopus microsporus]